MSNKYMNRIRPAKKVNKKESQRKAKKKYLANNKPITVTIPMDEYNDFLSWWAVHGDQYKGKSEMIRQAMKEDMSTHEYD